jgi:hypothetical protein
MKMMKESKQYNRGSKRPVAVGGKQKTTINPNMLDLSKDPYFVEKAERAKRLLAKYGTPKKMK